MNEFGHASSGLHCRWLLIVPAATLVASVGFMGTVRTDASATTPKLPALLLSVRRMPAGWKVSPTGNGQIGCFGNTMEVRGTAQTASASVTFQSSGGPQGLFEKLATYTNAKTGYKGSASGASACSRLKGRSAR